MGDYMEVGIREVICENKYPKLIGDCPITIDSSLVTTHSVSGWAAIALPECQSIKEYLRAPR